MAEATQEGAMTSQTISPPALNPGVEQEQRPFDHDCSWAEVMVSMEEARGEYKAKAENDKIRAIQRNRAVAATLQSLGEMIPEQDGLSVLRGGLNGIFKLLRKRIDNGDRILAAFEDIPITLGEACHALAARPYDEPLRNFVMELYTTLKEEISKLIQILLRKHKGSLPSRLFRQHPENEAVAIEKSLELISRASRRVTVRVGTLANETMVETLREARLLSSEISRTRIELQQGLNSIQTSQDKKELNDAARYEQLEWLCHTFVENTNVNLQRSLGNCESNFRTSFGGIQESIQELMWYAQSLSPPSLTARGRAGRSPSPCAQCEATCISSVTSSNSNLGISYDELYMILRLPNPIFLVEDLGVVLRAGNVIGHDGLSRAAWLLNMDRFRIWAQISGGLSDLVLVNGHLGNYCRGKISPLSVLCATFTSLDKFPHFLILTHFCGLHTNPRDPMSGGSGMLRGLIAQLIFSQRDAKDISYVYFDDILLNRIMENDLSALFQLFKALLAQVSPQITIYCIIDNISELETTLEGWENELRHVVHFMKTLSHQQRAGPVFKVLFTAANRSIQTFQQVDAGSVISLSAGNQSSRPTQRLSIEDSWTHALSPR